MNIRRWSWGVLIAGLSIFIGRYAGNTFIFQDYPRVGLASWYRSAYTATGEIMRPDEFTCALRRKDYGGKYRVCSMETGVCITVRHNNWGPAERYADRGRIIDLSEAAFGALAPLERGLIPVTVERVEGISR